MPAKRKPAAKKACEPVEVPDSTENDIEHEPPVKNVGKGKAAKPKNEVKKTEPEDVETVEFSATPAKEVEKTEPEDVETVEFSATPAKEVEKTEPEDGETGEFSATPAKEVEKTEREDGETDNPPAVRKRRQAAISAELKNQQQAAESRSTAPATGRPTRARVLKNKKDGTEETEQDEKPAPTRKLPAAKEPNKKQDAEKPKNAKKETKPKATKKAKEAQKPTEKGDAQKPAKAKGRPAKPKDEGSTQ